MSVLDSAGLNTIERLNHAIYPSLAMLAGMQLDLFTPLAGGPLTAAALAARLDVSAAKLRPLLDALVVTGLLAADGNRYANTADASRYLVKGAPDYSGGAHATLADFWSAALGTAETIRTGVPQAHHDFKSMSDAALDTFFSGLHDGNMARGRSLLAAGLDLGDRRAMLEVGGGSGGLAIALCEALPDLDVTVLELPRVAPITRRFVAGAGLDARISVAVGDAVAAPPDGTYDLAVLSSVVQVLGPEDAAALLRHVGQTMRPGGRIVIIGRVVGDDRRSPAHLALFNLVFINFYDAGLAHTEGEHRQWLEAAGFTDIQWSTLDAAALITAARARDR